MNGENITIGKNGCSITISSQAEPTNPTLTYSSISESWVSRNGNVLTINANSGANDRSFTLSVTATTTANTSYDGTATDSKTFTITQNGTGSTPTGTWYVVNTSSHYKVYGNFASVQSGYIGVDTNQSSTQEKYTTTPLTITEFNGVISPNVQTIPTVTFTNRRTGVTEQMVGVEGQGPETITWSGTMEIEDGDYLDFTIQGDY